MLAHKDATVKSNVDGVAFLFKKNKIDGFQGTGKVLGEGKVSVTNDEGEEQVIETKNIVIATGSDVAGIPGVEVEIDEKVIISSTGGIALEKVPATMVVVGGGVIGLELGSVWSRLGAKVTVVEYLDMILGGMDGEVAKQFQRMLAKQDVDIKLGAKVTGVEKSGAGAKVTFEPVKGGDAATIDADVVLIATGRKPLPKASALPRPASSWMRAAASRSTTISRPAFPASTQSATSCAARCSPTRQKTRVSPLPRSSPARPAT